MRHGQVDVMKSCEIDDIVRCPPLYFCYVWVFCTDLDVMVVDCL